MKISDYIKKLQAVQAEIGDAEVVTYDYGIKVAAYPPEVVNKKLTFLDIVDRKYKPHLGETPFCRV